MWEAVFQIQDLKVLLQDLDYRFLRIGSVISFGLDVSKLICDLIF